MRFRHQIVSGRRWSHVMFHHVSSREWHRKQRYSHPQRREEKCLGAQGGKLQQQRQRKSIEVEAIKAAHACLSDEDGLLEDGLRLKVRVANRRRLRRRMEERDVYLELRVALNLSASMLVLSSVEK